MSRFKAWTSDETRTSAMATAKKAVKKSATKKAAKKAPTKKAAPKKAAPKKSPSAIIAADPDPNAGTKKAVEEPSRVRSRRRG